MDKNLTWRIVLIIVLVVVAAWTLYPASKTLKPGIDLAGGTSLIYEIDTQGLEKSQRKDVAQRMITVLRRRVDPANIRNLIWRVLGSDRFEIQMPLASAEARQKRQNFEKALSALLDENINSAVIMRCLQKAPQQRSEDFEKFAYGSSDRLEILDNLAAAWDQRSGLRTQRDDLASKLEARTSQLEAADLDLEQIAFRRGDWVKLNDQQLTGALKTFLGLEDDQPDNTTLQLLTEYLNTYAEWAGVVEQLTDPESGKNIQYKNAKKELNKLNLTKDQMDSVLEMPADSIKKRQAIEDLKSQFSRRSEKIDETVAAFDEYLPSRGRLDDPRDLQRMLKGAGVLEFRILPTHGHPEIDPDQMAAYIESLGAKGPKYASDSKYVWCEIEKIKEWLRVDEQGQVFVVVTDSQERPSIVAPFGDKYYVLASNKSDEAMLYDPDRQWKLEDSRPTTDQMGRRAIGFTLNEKGGTMFGRVTGQNIDRPLCILLDGLAISAPNVNSRITTQGIITGRFDAVKVEDMVNKLNAGSLPALLIEQPLSVKSIGPLIGAGNRDKGIRAVMIGLVAVTLCMLIYYMLAGSIADVALLMNVLFVLAIMALVRATFTLPGIAGVILTIGMSVDANVLIFERIREEQRRGCSLRIAIKNGYQRALGTILDANLTTFIPAAILLWCAPEEVKGFAIVLMLGIVSSMFTALFVTRVFFDYLLSRRIIKDHLLMLRLIHKPNINWMSARPIFFGLSILLIAASLFVFFTRDDEKNSKYDIEFTGGTCVQINLKEGVSLTRQQVEDKIRGVGADLNNPALASAKVYSIGKSNKQYEIVTTETNRTTSLVTFPEAEANTVETVTSAIRVAEAGFRGRLSNLQVTQGDESAAEFVVSTSQINTSLVRNILRSAFENAEISQPQVDEVVNNAVLTAFGDMLEIQQNLGPKIVSQEKITEEYIDSYPELTDFLGGIKIVCEIEKAATAEKTDQRFRGLWSKPAYRDLSRYPYQILGSDLTAMEPNQPTNSFVYVSVEPEAGLRELSEDEWSRFVANEKSKVLAATELETSLPRVTQTDPSIGAQSKTRALIAIVLSLIAIVGYIWIRFGNARYGFAAIAALTHDVLITLGAVTACTYIAATPIGEKLLIGDFKINLAMIAAFLTLIGYSLNDTIVVFDRIRENRRKKRVTGRIISDSINQTLSRTILTSFTTFIVVLIMYIFGGQGLRGFTFAIGFGIIIGSYSSIAIAAPILLLGTRTEKAKQDSKQ